MSIWTKLLLAKSPTDIAPEDWKLLRSIAAQIQGFAMDKGESTSSKARRLLAILGFSSFKEMVQKHNPAFVADVFLVVELNKAILESGKSINKFSEENGLHALDGTYLDRQHLRNEYYEALDRLNIEPNDVGSLFAEEMDGITIEKYKQAQEAKRRVKISLPKAKV